MLTQEMTYNSLKLIKNYCGNLFLYITEAEFKDFLSKGYNYIKESNNIEQNNNFIFTFLKLFDEHKYNKTNIIREEFKYFNYLLGEFNKYENKKEFKNLLKAALYNFETNNFHHSLAEIGVCLILSKEYVFKQYERKTNNKKSIDFEFINCNKETILIEVYTIEYKKERYKKEKFKEFIDQRLKN